MPKPVKRVWTPDRIETNIGAGTYVIEPQPIERIIEFDKVVRQLREHFGGLSTKYYVERDGEYVHGPFADEAEARLHLNGSGDEIKEEMITFREILDTLVETPYPALSVLIPGLEEKDVRQASLPNLKFLLGLIIEVNGIEWFEAFLKNSIGPLLPEIVQSIVEGLKGTLTASTSDQTERPGETA